MSDALLNALADTERSYLSAKASLANPSASMLALAQSGLGMGNLSYRPTLWAAKEQLLHFKDWSYVAIGAIAKRIAGQSLYVGRVGQSRAPGRKMLPKDLPSRIKSLGERLEPLERHPLLDAIDNPNPLMIRWGLMYVTVASLQLTGRAHWWVKKTPRGLELWPLPSWWIQPKDSMQSAWTLRMFGTAEEVTLPREEVAYFALPDPFDPFWSLSPLQTQAAAIDADESLQRSQYRAFVNGVQPSYAIKVGKLPDMADLPGETPVLTEAQRLEITEAIRTYYARSVNTGAPLLIDGLIESIEPLGMKPAEMDFLNSGKAVKARIFQAFGVNPLIVGEIEGANRAQAVVAEKSFCSNVINPLLELLGQTLTKFVGSLFPSEKLVVFFDPARADDPETTLQEWDLALKVGAATLGEYRANVLNLPADPQFDVALTPATMLPLSNDEPDADDALKSFSRNGHYR